jgi:hypothetical protein
MSVNLNDTRIWKIITLCKGTATYQGVEMQKATQPSDNR